MFIVVLCRQDYGFKFRKKDYGSDLIKEKKIMDRTVSTVNIGYVTKVGSPTQGH